jgi:hypothetical protein
MKCDLGFANKKMNIKTNSPLPNSKKSKNGIKFKN